MQNLPIKALQEVAAYFQVLSEPTRLQILNLLREKPHNVGDMAQSCACTSANISRHLALLSQRGLVQRESRGNSVYYSIAEPSVYDLCDLVCGSIARQFETRHAQRMSFLQMNAPASVRKVARTRPNKIKKSDQK